jgi:hydroxyacylglutathione hydrolase
MIQKSIVVGPLQCNCMLLACERTGEAVLIDPGDEPQKILKALGEPNLKIKYLLHTHAHFDHFGATKAVKASSGGIVTLHKADEPLWNALTKQGQMFGFEFEEPVTVEKFVEDGEVLAFGDHRLEVIHTPGHSPGSLCFKLQDGKETIYSGDTLFYRSIGRADLWGGDGRQLLRSIRERLFVLEDDLKVYPGHGPSTLIGEEKRQNPFLS